MSRRRISMAVQAAALRDFKRQCNVRDALNAAMRHCSEALKMQEVVVFQIGACSADMHRDLQDMSLKLKFVVNGTTHLKSKPGKGSIGVDQQLRIKFDKLAGSAIYEGAEMLHFELHRAALLGSSQRLASCAVHAMTVLQSITNEPGQQLNLKLISIDTPGKVLANLTVHIGFTIATLKDLGGFRVLKIPSLKLPAHPKPVSTFTINENSEEIINFCDKMTEVRNRLKAAHGASMKAIDSCTKDAPQSNEHEIADATSMMASASRLGKAPRSSRPEITKADSASTSCGHLSAEDSSIEGCVSPEFVGVSTMTQSEQLEELLDGESTSSRSVAALKFSVPRNPDAPHLNLFDQFVDDLTLQCSNSSVASAQILEL